MQKYGRDGINHVGPKYMVFLSEEEKTLEFFGFRILYLRKKNKENVRQNKENTKNNINVK